jgi:hypothetical protein
MADNSAFITGVADGAFEDAFGDLPPWATEDTLSTIEGILSKTLNLQTKSFSAMMKALQAAKGSGSKVDADDAQKSLDDFTKELEDAKTKQKKRTKLDDEEDKKKKKRRDDEALGSKVLTTILSATGKGIEDAFKKNFETFDSFTKSGINAVAGMNNVATGFEGIQQLSVLTGIRFTELNKVMEKYSGAVNAFTAGKFAKTVGIATTDLAKFGFSSKESAELLGSYLDTQQGFTDASRKTEKQTAEDLTSFGSRINKLSLTLGMSRTAILANLEAISKSNEASILQGQAGSDAAESTLEFVASIKNQHFGQTLLKLMTDSIKPLNQTFMSFQKIGQGGFGQKLTAFTQSLKGMSPEAAAQAVKAFEAANHAEIEHNKQLANLYSQVPELAGEANAALTTYNELQQQARATVTLNAADQKKLEESQKARAELSTQWERLQSQFQQAFAPTIGMLHILTKGLTYLNTGIEKVTHIFGSSTTAWIGVGIMAISAATGMKLLINTMRGLSSGMGSFFGKLFSFGGGKGRAGRAVGNTSGGMLEGLGKGIGGLGKGIGAGLGGLLKGTLSGLAEGLVELGNPRVLLGVVALAGIAGGLWIAGKAIQNFVGLDWETMAKAGVALVALGAAGAAAGAIAPLLGLGALAIAGLGAALWVVGKGIQAVGPGIGMLADGLMKMGKVKASDLLSTSAAVAALTASLGAFAAASIASYASGKGIDTLNDIVTAVNKLDLAKVAALNGLGTISLPRASAPSTTNNLTTPKASTLNSPSQVSTKPEGEVKPQAPVKEQSKPNGSGIEKPTSTSDINNMLGYQTSLLEQLVQSTNSLVSVNKDILKYTRVHT